MNFIRISVFDKYKNGIIIHFLARNHYTSEKINGKELLNLKKLAIQIRSLSRLRWLRDGETSLMAKTRLSKMCSQIR